MMIMKILKAFLGKDATKALKKVLSDEPINAATIERTLKVLRNVFRKSDSCDIYDV